MSVQSVGQVVQSVKLFAGNGVGSSKDLIFIDFVGLCSWKKSKKACSSSSLRISVNGSNVQRSFLGSRKNWASFIKSVLDLERANSASQQSSDLKPKGIAVDELVVTPIENTGFLPEDATIVGNTCLSTATGCQVFSRGKAGECFAVRNSLAPAAVEGTGDHCCEYTTGGCVVVLGKNVAVVMTGGLAYILDEDDTLIPKEKRGSSKGAAILKEWDKYFPLFWQLIPPSEEVTPEACADFNETATRQVTLQSAQVT